jgi:hypothetical protein
MKFKPIQLILLVLFTNYSHLMAQNLNISVEPQHKNTEINQTIYVDIKIENVSNLGGFQFDIFYNTDVLHITSATVGDFIGSTGRNPFALGPEINNSSNPGKIIFGAASIGVGAGPSGDGILAKIEIITQAHGNTSIDLQNVLLSDISGQAIAIDSVIDGQIVVQAEVGNEIAITNTNDSGEGSLRWALAQANSQSGPNSLIFNIPKTDPNFDADLGVWTIRPLSVFPEIADSNLALNGQSQKMFLAEDTNPNGPEIEINGQEMQTGSDTFLLKIKSGHNSISHLIISGVNGLGIWLEGIDANFNHIWGNYIGTNATGVDPVPNRTGIYLSNGSFNIIGGDNPEFRNVISGNMQNGIHILNPSARGNRIIGNFIGTDVSGTKDLGNGWMGIMTYSGVYENIIGGILPGERNIISGNDNSGIRISGVRNKIIGNFIGTDVTGTKSICNEWAGAELWGGGFNEIGGSDPGEGNLISGNVGVGIGFNDTDNNQVIGNFIGTQAGVIGTLGNGASGIALTSGSKNNQIGPRNIVSNNGYAGVYFYADSTIQNTITQNSISNNYGPGIDYTNGGNNQLQPPSITTLNDMKVSGTAPANSIVEIFSDTDDEGKIFEGNITADNSGNYEWVGTPSGPYLPATATDAIGNTSIFSQPYFMTSVNEKMVSQNPNKYELRQNHPNPFNPETLIKYQLPNASFVEITIFNLSGQRINSLLKENQQAGSFELKWDGRNESGDQVVSGVYIYQLNAGEFVAAKKMILVR